MAKPDRESKGKPSSTEPASRLARKAGSKPETGDAPRQEGFPAPQDLPKPIQGLPDSSENLTEPSQDDIDESLEESFPASDPPSWVPLARLGSPKRKPRG